MSATPWNVPLEEAIASDRCLYIRATMSGGQLFGYSIIWTADDSPSGKLAVAGGSPEEVERLAEKYNKRYCFVSPTEFRGHGQ